jgi:hypothetical protein
MVCRTKARLRTALHLETQLDTKIRLVFVARCGAWFGGGHLGHMEYSIRWRLQYRFWYSVAAPWLKGNAWPERRVEAKFRAKTRSEAAEILLRLDMVRLLIFQYFRSVSDRKAFPIRIARLRRCGLGLQTKIGGRRARN